MVICLKRGADLHMAQLMPLPLTVSCSSKIQIGFAFLVPAHPGGPGQRAVKRVCVVRVSFATARRGADLVEERPAGAGDVEDGDQRAADVSGDDDQELADQDEVHFRSVGAHLPLLQPIDGQCHAHQAQHEARDHRVSRERRPAHVIYDSVRQLAYTQGEVTSQVTKRSPFCEYNMT